MHSIGCKWELCFDVYTIFCHHIRLRGSTLDKLVNVITFPVTLMQEVLFVVVRCSTVNTSTAHNNIRCTLCNTDHHAIMIY